MATVTVRSLVSKAQIILQDTTGTRWPNSELLDWLNDSYREVILARPDANSQTADFTCAAGTRQVLTAQFPTALRLLDVVRNVGSGSAKHAVRLIDRAILDDQRPGWHTEAMGVDIEHFMFDPRVPTEFLVYPPASTSARLEVVYASVPTAHSMSGSSLPSDTVRINDSYANVMLDYMLYRAYTKDAEYAANAQRAANHYTAMVTALGVKTTVDTEHNPKDPGFTTYAK